MQLIIKYQQIKEISKIEFPEKQNCTMFCYKVDLSRNEISSLKTGCQVHYYKTVMKSVIIYIMICSINKLKLNEQLVLLFPGEPAPDDSNELEKKKNCTYVV